MTDSMENNAATTVLSTHVHSFNEKSILVEAGGFTPLKWFLNHALRTTGSDDSDSDLPKSKRRKLNNYHNVKSESLDQSQRIPVSRFVLDLHFPEDLTASADANLIMSDLQFFGSQAIAVHPSAIDHFDDGAKLKLGLARNKGEVITIQTTGLTLPVFDAIRQHAAFRPKRLGRSLQNQPKQAVEATCNLSCLPEGADHPVARLEFLLHWNSGVSAFSAGAPVGKERIYPEYNVLLQSFPDTERVNSPQGQWTPQQFYDSIHVPAKDVDVQDLYQDVLDTQLYPFQKRAVSWMLRREDMEVKDNQIHELPPKDYCRPIQFYKEFKDLAGGSCYVSHLQGIVSRQLPASESLNLRGGLLAEEMGLGKTVEMMTLVTVHKRGKPFPYTEIDASSGWNLRCSKATLIIAPASILQQWRAEIARHAPSLRVFNYEGITSKHVKRKAEDELLSDLATKYDIVLTTYQTLRQEVHFAEDPPKRDMRRAPKFDRKRSPLVQIQWWRVCLDEAQMVESGVSAAARVAQRLPRINSWAVTGTPLRKDIQDLHGLLVFLRLRPFSDDGKLWGHLVLNHRHLFGRIFGSIALRHTKALIRDELHLPAQKRVVITMPFSAVEQQHYSTLFTQMCEEVGVTEEGAPISGDWDPENAKTVEAMRIWLVRLRQTCLHPQLGGRNRRAFGRGLGRGNGPLRTVAEVLEVMIDQNETSVRTEERNLLNSQLTHAHIIGNDRQNEHRSEEALEIYSRVMQSSSELVQEARTRLESARQEEGIVGGDALLDVDSGDEDSSPETAPLIGKLRNNLRTTLQLQHVCTFFAATAYFQIKSNENLTTPDSDSFKQLEEKETGLYESAKMLRREILRDVARKSQWWMDSISDLTTKNKLTKMPKLTDLEDFGGIESRKFIEKSDDLFDVLREQAKVAIEWRAKMSEHLLKPLVDVDGDNEITGDEYEDSTKLQDELYVYFDAIKALQADMSTFTTGQDAPLIDHEVKTAIKACKKFLDPETAEDMRGNPYAPELALQLYATRNKFRMKKDEVSSIRGLIQEARTLESNLQFNEGSARGAERAIIRRHVTALQDVFNAYTKALTALEKEIDMFRRTQNQRLQFYRRLQEVSDAVKPFREELDEQLDQDALDFILEREELQIKQLGTLKTKQRFLLHLRDESGGHNEERICVICQCPFERGVLTICGHQYCKECINHWWSAHRTCPVCKRKLALVDFHDIAYKPQQLRAQEENQPSSSSSNENSYPTSTPSRGSIYSDVDGQVMNEIKSIDLPSSYGTKIDTLGRHLHWLRLHDLGAKSIVFSQYREFLDVLGSALTDFKIGFSRIGNTRAIERFKHDASIDCLLVDAKTDSSGLTLVNATHVFICEPLIQTAVELQAIARVHRIGQTRPTTVWMYLITDTVEESIYEVSVARRLAHVQSRESSSSRPATKTSSRAVTPAPATATTGVRESELDAANSEEIQSASLSKLLAPERGGGEMVVNDDLWRCLFGKVKKEPSAPSAALQSEVDRHLRGEAAEARRGIALR